MQAGLERFPWDAWKMDPPDRTADPRLMLRTPWKFEPENGIWSGAYQFRESPIPGTSTTQAEIWAPLYTQAVLRVGPRNDWPDDDYTSYPQESTLTLYLSRKRWYDCFVDLSVNRLFDPDKPVFVQYLRGDGIRVPSWNVEYRKDSGPYAMLLSCDPDGDDHRFIAHQGSVTQKLTEVWNPQALESVTDSGTYYVDGSSPYIPVSENGIVHVFINPYSNSQRVLEYQSFSDPTHRYIQTLSGGSWSTWRQVTVT